LTHFFLAYIFSGWIPPSDSWASYDRLPYGWESAVDQQGKTYFINHLNKTTTAEDPRKWDGFEHVRLSRLPTKTDLLK
jgi:hypothetical protein